MYPCLAAGGTYFSGMDVQLEKKKKKKEEKEREKGEKGKRKGRKKKGKDCNNLFVALPVVAL